MTEITPSAPAPQGQGDLLEQLLVIAAQKAAENEAKQALEKGFITRKDFNDALTAFSVQLEESLIPKIVAAVSPTISNTVQKAMEPSLRKGTIRTPQDEFEEDPVKYLLKKGETDGPEAYTDAEKRIIWGLTYAGLSMGMREGEGEE